MNPYLKVSGLDIATCASLLGYSPRLFGEWAAGQRAIPPSVAAHIASVLSVDANALLSPPRQAIDETEIEPAIWFKLRSQELGRADRELVFLVRQLGTFYEELEHVRSRGGSSGWKLAFEQVRQGISVEAPPREQGRLAAQILRSLLDWNKGRSGIGELLRPSLRNLGILIVESPIIDSKIEGCAFPVGTAQRPCIFANTHGTTWYRRNEVILHELAHLIFDLGSEGAALDIFDAKPRNAVSEIRAEAFSQEAAVPKEVLAHIAQRHGISWDLPMSGRNLASIVAETYVEVRLVVRAAVDSGLLAPDQRENLLQLQIREHLKEISDHALSTQEYLRNIDPDAGQAWKGKRNTTVPSRILRLPVNYIDSVVEACKERLISVGKAAQLLMISEDDLAERFGLTQPLDTD